MNARHAAHPEPYDAGCPDCTGDYPARASAVAAMGCAGISGFLMGIVFALAVHWLASLGC